MQCIVQNRKIKKEVCSQQLAIKAVAVTEYGARGHISSIGKLREMEVVTALQGEQEVKEGMFTHNNTQFMSAPMGSCSPREVKHSLAIPSV